MANYMLYNQRQAHRPKHLWGFQKAKPKPKAEVSEALQVLLDLPPTVGKRRTKYSGLTSKKKRNVTIKKLELIMKTRGLSAEIRIYHKELGMKR